ncbi:MOSC domain-containing protein [Nocardioides sp.]|uniref:MOSC domain-containing protein n=1 Tax=Nocardioides sp. TaxID=35761 RepID=UPI0027330B84|nr:MOSC N-terminal beta barrel domain-containing protein [Nocardioides sp.]MDP3894573.1 MOSC domain-containing protein [Nocardioides sp.]
MRVTSLHRYPVKSLAGLDEEWLDIAPGGPVGDRRWAVVDLEGAKVTARKVPAMLALRAELTPEGVRLRTPDGSVLEVARPAGGRRVPVDFSRLDDAVDAGEEAAGFLSTGLGRAVRLVWQPAVEERSVKPDNGGLPGEVLSLADAGPLLLTSEASLARLQEWVGVEPHLSMARFRPNVVVDGGEPFEEDGWGTVRLGELAFRVQHTCDRCVLTTIDPVTLTRGPEPIRTLSLHRKWDGAVWFGIWLVPRGSGRIAVGDRVTVG